MHPLTKLTSREGDLLRKLGKSHEFTADAGTLTLGFSPQPHCELVLECVLEEQSLHLGVFEQQWCTWLAAELPVPSWPMLAEDLRLPLAALSLAPLQKVLQTLHLPYPTARRIGKAPPDLAQKGWFLRLEHEGRLLHLQLLNTPLEWLASLIDVLTPVQEPHDESPSPLLSVPLVAGWSTLERERLLSMQCGDALVLRNACPVAEARCILFLQRPLATVKVTPPNTLHIESTMSDFNEWLDIQAAPCTDTASPFPEPLVTVVAEVAHAELPLNRLAHLKKGDILEGQTHQNELVTLKVAGRPFAYGLLLDINGQLAVRIERLA